MEFNFLEVANTTNNSINVWVVGKSRLGAEVFIRTFTVNAEGRFDLDVHYSIVGNAVYGSLFLSHDGPQGAFSRVQNHFPRTIYI